MVDLPGYGYEAEQGKAGCHFGLYSALPLRAQVFEAGGASGGLQEGDTRLRKRCVEFLRTEGLQYVVVATKIDKMKKNEAVAAIQDYKRARLDDDQMLGFSAVTGEAGGICGPRYGTD